MMLWVDTLLMTGPLLITVINLSPPLSSLK
nr:MAG TPA: hypothetical protein [Caudoviricetes sp.]